MTPATINDISFEEDDFCLFNSENVSLELKAKAIQYSILPKLNVILSEAVSFVRKVYGISILDDNSTVSTWPAFRDKRENDLSVDYTSAYSGIGGTRKPVWKGLERDDGKEVKIIPFTMGFLLAFDGCKFTFKSNRYNVKINKNSVFKYIDFLEKYSSQLCVLINSGMMSFWPFAGRFSDGVNGLIEVLKTADTMDELKFEIFSYRRSPSREDIKLFVTQFVFLYPLYDSFIRISLGEKERFLELLDKLDDYLENPENDLAGINDSPRKQLSVSQIENIQKTVDGMTVRAGIRWQVFDRDNFRCVACGKSALDGAILHVDHIQPRSLGGKDELDNFQTLCHLCNIGKSNKSNRNLREREDK